MLLDKLMAALALFTAAFSTMVMTYFIGESKWAYAAFFASLGLLAAWLAVDRVISAAVEAAWLEIEGPPEEPDARAAELEAELGR